MKDLLPNILDSIYFFKEIESRYLHEKVKDEDLKKAIYLNFRRWNSLVPDHVFNSKWKTLFKSEENLVQSSLFFLANHYLENRSEKIYVKINYYNEWQDLLSRVSSLPIQAAFLASRECNNYDTTVVIYPHDPVIEEYIATQGLHETHLHLNGTTSAEFCWLRALSNPKQELMEFNYCYNNQVRVRELCHSIDPNLDPKRLNDLLFLARDIRSIIIDVISNKGNRENLKIFCKLKEIGKSNLLFHHPIIKISEEVKWMKDLLCYLKDHKSNSLDRLFHAYLLIQAQYFQIMIQQKDMFGFDQFQKYTLTDLRELAEKDYLERFKVLHGNNQNYSNVNYLEGRFAPKSDINKMNVLLMSILRGYAQYLAYCNKDTSYSNLTTFKKIFRDIDTNLEKLSSRGYLKLALVIHFIKKPFNENKEVYRYANLHKTLLEQVLILEKLLKLEPELKSWIRGIDAAANELDAPPEVFAPYYRYCKNIGIQHRTYHAGEDFRHFLSGIRQVMDVINLLNLGVGDRLGHGTVLGIKPSLWVESMPEILRVKRGDWLIDLLSIWEYLMLKPTYAHLAYKISSDIDRLSYVIFGKQYSCPFLSQVMHLRHLTPNFVFKQVEEKNTWKWQFASLNDEWRKEAKLVSDVAKEQFPALEVLYKWLFNKETIKKSEELIEVEALYFGLDEMELVQQIVLTILQEKRIIIETLPTSNLRISQYQVYEEHHSFRWMKVPFMENKKDPNVLVSLGSDDPGIFANDIKSDFYQLYAVMHNKGLNDSQSLKYLTEMNERGRYYRFHEKEKF